MTDAICLSGGGAKGDFELGALRLLYDRGIRPQILSSTSVGSINAIKLAEGEDASRPDQGMSGLERIWAGLQTNSDMYSEESWLQHPDMDPRVRDVLTGKTSSLGISAPAPSDGRWGDLDGLVDTLSRFAFLIGDGAALLKSLNVISSQARALYNLDPIRRLLDSHVDLSAVAAWAAAGGRLRMAAVGLESGNLRYITESGAVVERDGSPSMWAGPLSLACRQLGDVVTVRVSGIRQLQDELRAAAPGDKGAIVEQIRDAQEALAQARREFTACIAAQPPVALNVDLRDGVMASASMPGIFPTVRLGHENYVDGGVREIIPLRAALGMGATRVYAIAASPLSVAAATGSYDNAMLADVVGRSILDIALNEIELDDLLVSDSSIEVVVIAPDFEIHDTTTVDPGLIQISRDYGYMRAADALDGAAKNSVRWTTATDIARTRLATWRAENQRYGHEDPTRRAAGTPPPDPAKQTDIAAGKAALGQLLDQRVAVGGPMPADIKRWRFTLELHPWAANINDAVCVSQTVPTSMSYRGPVAAFSVTMRNTGTTTWSAEAAYALGSQSPQDNTAWGINRVALPHAVPPGTDVTFTGTISAPHPPGAAFQWRMVQDGHEWFGSLTSSVTVTVPEPAECANLRSQMAQLKAQILTLQAELSKAPPGEKADIAEQIRSAQESLNTLKQQSSELGCA